MAAQVASMYDTADGWAQSPRGEHMSMTTTDYLGFPVANARSTDGHFALGPNMEQSSPSDYSMRAKTAFKRSFNDFDTRSSPNAAIAPLTVSTAAMYPSSAMFTTSNAHRNTYDGATISPLDAHFDADHASPSSDSKLSFDGQMHNLGPSSFTAFSNDSEPLSKRRCDSLQSTFDAQSPTMAQSQVGRRRGSEYAEPGSARAVYLEKNRKAASKCRTKQKRQQEELVETARDVERRNRILKAEVEMLKSGMRELMELVGQHTECPDTRLKLYVQREADRLATGGQRQALPSSFSKSSYSGTGPVDKVSSPEDE